MEDGSMCVFLRVVLMLLDATRSASSRCAYCYVRNDVISLTVATPLEHPRSFVELIPRRKVQTCTFLRRGREGSRVSWEQLAGSYLAARYPVDVGSRHGSSVTILWTRDSLYLGPKYLYDALAFAVPRIHFRYYEAPKEKYSGENL